MPEIPRNEPRGHRQGVRQRRWLAAVHRVAAPGQPVLGERLVPGRDHRMLRQPGGAATREHRPAVRRRQAPAADVGIA